MMMESKETDRQTTCRAHYDNLPFFFFIYLRYAIHFIVFLFLWNHLSYARPATGSLTTKAAETEA